MFFNCKAFSQYSTKHKLFTYFGGAGRQHKLIASELNCFYCNYEYQQFLNNNFFNLAFRDDEGKPWVLPVVAKVEAQMAQGILDRTLNHEYLEIDGLRLFSDSASKFLLGKDSPAVVENRVSKICVNQTRSQ